MVHLHCVTMFEAVTLQMVRELLEIQDRSYRSTFQLSLTDMKEDVKSLKKDIDELKHSLQFSQKDIKDLSLRRRLVSAVKP